MAVCKKCGSVMVTGSRDCDVCAAHGISAGPAPQAWQPPPASEVNLSYKPAWAVPTGVASSASLTKAASRVRWAWGAAAFVGVVNIGIGAAAEFVPIPILLKVGFGWPGIIEGLIYLVLAYFIYRLSVVALLLAMGLYALDAVVTLIAVHSAGGVGVRIVVLLIFWRAIGAIADLKKSRAAAKADETGTKLAA
jgi:hypothetical protein